MQHHERGVDFHMSKTRFAPPPPRQVSSPHPLTPYARRDAPEAAKHQKPQQKAAAWKGMRQYGYEALNTFEFSETSSFIITCSRQVDIFGPHGSVRSTRDPEVRTRWHHLATLFLLLCSAIMEVVMLDGYRHGWPCLPSQARAIASCSSQLPYLRVREAYAT